MLARNSRVIALAAAWARSRPVASSHVISASSSAKPLPATPMMRADPLLKRCSKSGLLRTATVQVCPAKPMYSCASKRAGRAACGAPLFEYISVAGASSTPSWTRTSRPGVPSP